MFAFVAVDRFTALPSPQLNMTVSAFSVYDCAKMVAVVDSDRGDVKLLTRTYKRREDDDDSVIDTSDGDSGSESEFSMEFGSSDGEDGDDDGGGDGDDGEFEVLLAGHDSVDDHVSGDEPEVVLYSGSESGLFSDDSDEFDGLEEDDGDSGFDESDGEGSESSEGEVFWSMRPRRR